MKIDGRKIAQQILDNLKTRTDDLKHKGTIPHLAIIFVGNDPASASYIRQKIKKAEEIGAKATVNNLESRIQNSELLNIITKYNKDKNVHGIIVQRPLPQRIDTATIDKAIEPQKDVDGFHPQTPYSMPLANAVVRILEEVYSSKTAQVEGNFQDWLKSQTVVVIGKGKTGGGPIIEKLRAMTIEPKIIDSKTHNAEHITRLADIIISTVGKPNVLAADMIKNDAAVIGVGMYLGEDGKMHGDYNQEEIGNVVAFYTPVPGGVGPVNVAMLLQNLVTATEK